MATLVRGPYGCFLPDLTRFEAWRRSSPFEILSVKCPHSIPDTRAREPHNLALHIKKPTDVAWKRANAAKHAEKES